MRLYKIPRCKRIIALSWHPTRREVAAITSSAEDQIEEVVWFDVTTGSICQRIALDVERCALSPDHRCLVVGHAAESKPRGASAIQWANIPAEGTKIEWNNLQGVPHKHIFGLTFISQGNGIAVGCSGQRRGNREWVHAIYLTALTGDNPVHFEIERLAGEITLSADEEWMAVCGGIGAEPDICFHRFPSQEPTAIYKPKSTRTQRIAFHPNKPLLAALCGKQLILIPAGHKEPLAIHDAHSARANDLIFTPDGGRLLTAGQDATIHVWDSLSGSLINGYSWSIGKTTAVAAAPDGCTAAAAGEKGQIVIWDLEG